VDGQHWRRYVAPAAFLLAVTVVVVLVRSGLHAGKAGSSPPAATATTPPATTTRATTTTGGKKKPKPPARRYWTVQAGDTFSVISSKTGVPVATLSRLNPKASSTSLFIGEKIRIK
jgi:LysM repeat protein